MIVLRRLRDSARAALGTASNSALLDALLQLELSREMARLQRELRTDMPDNPAGRGFKVYSQADEDGIIEEIARRVGIEKGSFIEVGCGNGLENNTHYLLLKGWRGIWVDGDSENIAAIRSALPTEGRLSVVQQTVTRENVAQVSAAARSAFMGTLDLLSIDVDGNDLAIAEAAIGAWSPKILVAEYNAKFPPQIAIEIGYDPEHRWAVDDYHGASLGAWVKRLQSDYRLVACNLAGTNAFFVRNSLAGGFPGYLHENLYQPARFHLTALRSGHPPSLSFLRRSLLEDTG